MVESPPQDENQKELDYYNDVERDTEMRSQETVPASSQETAPASSQESASQDMASMPNQDSTTNVMILDAVGGTLMEDESCLEGLTLRCILAEERVLLNPSFNETLDQLNDVPLGYLNVLVACIKQTRKTKLL